jgi:sec-independent protein translocase protein TatA
MALDPLELIVVGVILIVIFLWGPQKIPEIARAIGRARKEYEQASKELSGALTAAGSPPATTPPSSVPSSGGSIVQSPPSRTGDELLIETARKLGISTMGKTREQISEEIVGKNSS